MLTLTMFESPIRVLLADDSSVIRRLLTEALRTDKEIEVVGVGQHGAEALQLLASKRPDVVLLDVEMPVMDGVETVIEIRKRNTQLPIIMFSSITTRGGEATLDAMSHGANDYVTKPSKLGHAGEAIIYIRNELVPKIKLWGRRQHSQANAKSKLIPSPAMSLQHLSASGPVANAAPPPAREFSGPIEIIAIGASTGRPNALAEVLNRLPRDLSVPIVITQHMRRSSRNCSPRGSTRPVRCMCAKGSKERFSKRATCGSRRATST